MEKEGRNEKGVDKEKRGRRGKGVSTTYCVTHCNESLLLRETEGKKRVWAMTREVVATVEKIEHAEDTPYPGLVDQVAAELPYVLDDGHLVFHTVLPKLTGGEFLLQDARCTCVTTGRNQELSLNSEYMVHDVGGFAAGSSNVEFKTAACLRYGFRRHPRSEGSASSLPSCMQPPTPSRDAAMWYNGSVT